MNVLILTICAVGLLAFNPRVVYPCSCVYGSPRQERKKAKAVFVGQVVEVYSGSGRDDYPAIAELKVERYWKGIKKSETIEVLSDMGLHSCRAVLYKKGARYIVYAFEDKGSLVTHGCTRTREIEEAAEDLKELGEGKILKASE
ncbi:MAG TPA: hypothetical protein VEF04_06750 [Blastocatellia bacterium]|nr:hypothetical protein [Blastocatellia bacterium]